jgi:hypothetical protein
MTFKIADFQAWLEAQPAEAVVGLPRSNDHCPIASWLSDTLSVTVTVSSIAFRVQGYLHELPRWAQLFVLFVDQQGNAEINASQALQLLERARIVKADAVIV